MFIYQNELKVQLKSVDFIRTEYNGQNTEEIAKTLALAYTKNNDLFRTLNLTFDSMYKEFMEFLLQHKYRWILVYYEREAYQKQIFNIIAIISYTDILDLKLTSSESEIINYDIVPTPEKVRLYVRLKALKYFFDRCNPKFGEYCVTGAFAFSQQHMGARQSLVIYSDSIKFIQSKGYMYGFGWTSNDIAKNLYDKLHLVLRDEYSLSEIYIEKTKQYPYKNVRMQQVLYIGDVDKSVIKLEQIINDKN